MSAFFKPVTTVLELLRWSNCVMAGFAALVGTLIAFLALPDSMHVQLVYEPVLVFSVVFLVTGAGNVINDYFDHKIDSINRPDRPIPSGRIQRKTALYIAISLFVVGILLSLFLGPLCLFLAIVNSLLLIFYASTFKRMVLIGNLVVGYLAGSTFLFGGALEIFNGMGIRSNVVLFLLAILVTMAREIVKDIQDIEGDSKAGATTLPITVGKEFSTRLTAVLGLTGVILSPLPLLLNEAFGVLYLVIIFVADLLLLLSINEIILKDNSKKSSRLLKIAMFVALIAFVAGTIPLNNIF
ncbi:MAG TPA: geranylgeranylglycerol-phosphate geranylgeranyltransferase [archaeon]|nr:geranylgeranylglycerol-phosphate geranylgeranyltransferase [archaeon]